MRKILLLTIIMIFLALITTSGIASDMDKGSMHEKGSMKGSMYEDYSMHDSMVIEDDDDEDADDGYNEDAEEDEMDFLSAEEMEEDLVTAWALIKGTDPESTLEGTVELTETGGGVRLKAVLTNVKSAGKHGFHIHENGSCAEGGKAAGGHFNPGMTQHGNLPIDGDQAAHAGDMGNIMISPEGAGTKTVFMPGLSLTSGDKNIAGKAIILHAKEDDFGQPTGNAGGRIGCGIISLN